MHTQATTHQTVPPSRSNSAPTHDLVDAIDCEHDTEPWIETPFPLASEPPDPRAEHD